MLVTIQYLIILDFRKLIETIFHDKTSSLKETVHAGKYRTEGKLKTQTIQKVNTTQKKQTAQNIAHQNYPGLVAFYDTRLKGLGGQRSRAHWVWNSWG